MTPRKLFLIAYDLSASVAALIMALYIVYDGHVPVNMLNNIKVSWFVIVALAGLCFSLIGFYTQMWAFARGSQYLVLIAGTVLHLFLMVLSLQLMKRNLPFAAYIIYWFLLTSAVLAIRIFYRFYQSRRQVMRMRKRTKGDQPIRVMVVGAGSAASQIIVELKTKQNIREPICAVDDNPLTHFYKNNGVPVLGDRNDIVQLAKQHNIDEIIVAIPSASSETLREILAICQETNCRVRLLPFFSELLSDEVGLSDIRDINIEDLLGRDPVQYDTAKVSGFIRDKVVLVTGGGGSIGSELAKQIASFSPSLLILFDIYENGVYDIQQELLAHYGPTLNVRILIGSVQDGKRLSDVFSELRPNIVFHAAAHKHVPLMEDSPGEAVKNNVYGTYNTALISALYGTERFVFVSTDKAVNPTNVMGATKRLCEIAILTLDRILKDTQFSAVRFGNVLGSSGSVIPLFEKQIEERRAVTVTHPEVQRFFMTIPEASSLVLQAGAYAKGGEIFVLDMGDLVRIDDLARDMIRISGLVPGVDIPIEYIGLRPGEKMIEELFLSQETTERTEHKKIFTLSQIDNLDFLRNEIETLVRLVATDEVNLATFMEQLMTAL
ncbi:MAG: polysaccharide biosynthesis protein, partial [Clostridiaceae bacterium]|nr:polysaccharide biosynthesis protein [Clostridiaceae bacterium]